MEFTLGKKIFEAGCVAIDGRMDEPVWAEAEEFTGFRRPEAQGAVLAERQTSFKILPCADRIYVGVRCEEPDIDFVVKSAPERTAFGADSVEIFLSPGCTPFSFYQFCISVVNKVYAF